MKITGSFVGIVPERKTVSEASSNRTKKAKV